ncbi:MAG TPA: TlpA disulfide reductase family protein [Pyrinomonadaceae bacterium]|nr:TlpA disulfide reductase family protein [Pyrinomonadaceae bacterium]
MYSKLLRSPLVPVFAIVGLSVFLIACSNDKPGGVEATPVLSGPPSTTFPMPPLKPDADIGWLTAEGQRQRLGEYRGKVLVLDFYATWCAPCRQSIPHLVKWQQELSDKGLQIVGLNVGGADDRIKVADFARELKINYPLGFPDKSLTDFFLSDNQTLPQTFVFGRDGTLVKRLIGFQASTKTELEKAIASGLEAK